MAFVEASIDVRDDISAVYDQWTRFESFPRFMESIRDVTQLDDTHLRWIAVVAGRPVEWLAEITEQVPDTRISWRSVSGDPTSGAVTFAALVGNATRVTLRLEYRPDDLREPAGQALGTMQHRVSQDLQNFKDVIEDRGEAGGERRGRIAS